MPTDRAFFALAVLLYGVSATWSFFLWRRGFRQDSRGQYLLLFSAAVLHTVAMAKRGFTFITVGTEIAMLREGAAAQLKTLKG